MLDNIVHQRKELFYFVTGGFLIVFLMILVSAFINDQAIWEVRYFSDLGSRESAENQTWWMFEIDSANSTLKPEVFNIAILLIGLTMVFFYYMLSTNWKYKNMEEVRISNYFGILAGVAIILLALFDNGAAPVPHHILVIVLLIAAVFQMITWLYATRDTKNPFNDDLPFVMIVVVLWTMVLMSAFIPYTFYWKATIFKSALIAYLVYAMFVPIRLMR